MSKVRDILYIDDESGQLLAAATAKGVDMRFAHYEPTDNAAARAASRSNVWVFDFYNDDEQRINPDLTGVAKNGLSVFQQLRAMVGDARPPAILVSNHIEEALAGAVVPARRHILAKQVGVEWVAAKQDDSYDTIAEIAALADATAALYSRRKTFQGAHPSKYPAELAAVAFGMPRRALWAQAAVREVGEWRPPTWISPHETIDTVPKRAGLTVRDDVRSVRDVIAWMIRHILPYPSFLCRDRHVAVRLGIDLLCLRKALAAETRLAAGLRQARYTGILKDFDGERWWTAAIDAFDWGLPREKTDRTKALAKLVDPIPLIELAMEEPVVVSDPDLVETDEIAELTSCVRASDESFPAQASPAWVKIEDARKEDALARKVRLEDQAELSIEAKTP